ncbi:hypothetical protein FQN60_014647, partial [Etheostoma spectabile]
MEMVYHEEDCVYENIPDVSARRVESKICSDEDRKVTAAEPDAEAGFKNLTEEREDLKRKLNISDAEAGFKNLTEERDDLKRKLNNFLGKC